MPFESGRRRCNNGLMFQTGHRSQGHTRMVMMIIMNKIMILGLILILKLISNGSLAPGTGQMMRIEMYGDPVVWLLTILIGLTNVRC